MLDALNAMIAVAILLRLIDVATSMNGTTRHHFRFALVALAVTSLAYALWPLFGEWPAWMDTLMIASVAFYVFTDKRRKCPERAA